VTLIFIVWTWQTIHCQHREQFTICFCAVVWGIMMRMKKWKIQEQQCSIIISMTREMYDVDQSQNHFNSTSLKYQHIK
jgi:hypothetical protein